MPSRQFVTFDVANQFFGVPVGVVQEVLLNETYTPMPGAPDAWGGLFNLRGEVIGTIDLRVRFGPPPRPLSGSVVNVVVLAAGEPVSLLVDRIGLVADLDDTAFERPPDTLTGPTRELVVGTYKTEDRLLLLLDVEQCVSNEDAVGSLSDSTIGMPELILPTVVVRDSFLSAMAEFRREGRGDPEDQSMIGNEIRDFGDRWASTPAEFSRYVDWLRAQAHEDSPRPAGYVPSTTLWWADGDDYLGRLAIRHRLTPHLHEIGGHIGYDVPPISPAPRPRDGHADGRPPDRRRPGHRVGPDHLRRRQHRLPPGDRTRRRHPGRPARRQPPILDTNHQSPKPDAPLIAPRRQADSRHRPCGCQPRPQVV